MGRITKGILGGFSGTVGTVVGANWKGVDYMRSRSGKRRGSNSPEQAEQRARFALAARFLHNLRDVLAVGFRDHAVKMTEVNSALGYTLKNAVTGSYPDLSIAYPQVLVSRGSLPNAVAPSASAGDDSAIRFSWTDNSGMGKARGNDRALLVAYCEALRQAVYTTDPLRSSAEGVLNVPAFSGYPVQTWISFIAEDGKDIATSVFTGAVDVG